MYRSTATAALLVFLSIACKTPQSEIKSSTSFDPTTKVDLLTYRIDFTEQDFEKAYDELHRQDLIFDNYKCMRKRVEKRLQDVNAANLTKGMKFPEVAGLILYTSSSYYPINSALRSIRNTQNTLSDPANKDISPELKAKLLRDQAQAYSDIKYWDLVIKGAASALNSLPTHKKRVLRGGSLTDEIVKSYCRHECKSSNASSCPISTEAAFMSTTANKDVGGFRGNVQFIVDGKNGRHIADLSDFPNENEVLFPPGADFFIKKVVFSNGMTCSDFAEGKFSIEKFKPAPTDGGGDGVGGDDGIDEGAALTLAPTNDDEHASLGDDGGSGNDGDTNPIDDECTRSSDIVFTPSIKDALQGLSNTPFGIELLNTSTQQNAFALAETTSDENLYEVTVDIFMEETSK